MPEGIGEKISDSSACAFTLMKDCVPFCLEKLEIGYIDVIERDPI